MQNKPISIKDAKDSYHVNPQGIGTFDVFSNLQGFANYSPAYTITNEDLRWATGLTASIAQRVLTTCASGDHPLFYALNGATDIDTFDISINARAIMEIKTAVIPNISRDEYIKMLNALHKNPKFNDVAHMHAAMSRVSPEIAKYLGAMTDIEIFASGWRARNYPEHMPTPEEYTSLQHKITKPFNFIWSDVVELHNHLDSQYDVINLSNIFEYLQADQIIKTLKDLHEHVRPGGYIIAHTSSRIAQDKYAAYDKYNKLMAGNARVGELSSKQNAAGQSAIIVQRTK